MEPTTLGPLVLNWTINVGNLLNILIMVAGITGFFYSIKSDIKILRVDLKHLEAQQASLADAFKQLGGILTQIALQDSRLGMMEKSLDEIRHGDGFIRKK